MRSLRAGMPFILFTVLLDMLGIGLIVPVLPNLITQMRGGDISVASGTYGWFAATYALMQFIFAPVLGNLSDTFGRRPVILVSLFGAGLDYILMSLAPNLAWLFAGRVIARIVGAVQGALRSLQSLTGIAGPILATQLFGYFTSGRAIAHVPGAAFFAGSLLVWSGTALAIRFLPRTPERASIGP